GVAAVDDPRLAQREQVGRLLQRGELVRSGLVDGGDGAGHGETGGETGVHLRRGEAAPCGFGGEAALSGLGGGAGHAVILAPETDRTIGLRASPARRRSSHSTMLAATLRWLASLSASCSPS